MIHKNLEKFRIACKNLETPMHEMINKKLEKFQMTQKKCEKHVSVYALQTVSQTFAQCCLYAFYCHACHAIIWKAVNKSAKFEIIKLKVQGF